MRRQIAMTLITILLVAFQARAEGTNQKEVRSAIETDGWKVVYGPMVTEAEHPRLMAAITEGIVTGNPALVLAYFKDFEKESLEKLTAGAPEMTRKALMARIEECITAGGGKLEGDGVEIRFAVATYNRHDLIVVEVVAGAQCQARPPSCTIKMKKIERKAPLPNVYQPYIAVRIWH
jgi:hypothetical protein